MGSVEVEALAMAAGGDAFGREPGGRVVFVEGALPGEEVLVELTQEKKDFARGRVVEVLRPSTRRVDPPCPAVARGCGGCQWQHIDPEAQAEFKRDIVADALRRIAKADEGALRDKVVRVAAARTTLRLAVEGGRPGFRKRHSHEVVPVDGCLVAHPLLGPLLQADYAGAEEVLLRVGVSSGERVVGSEGVVHEDVAGRRWQVSARSFFQPGPDAAEALVAAVWEAAGDRPGFVVDAYAGVGLLGGAVVDPAGRLVAVESSPWAAADAQVNLADLDAVVVEGDVADAVPALGLTGVDLVIADPARPGLGATAAAALAGLRAPRLVLVSCDPASFARDVRLLGERGYRLADAQVLDLFPHTFHMEVVSRFDAVP